MEDFLGMYHCIVPELNQRKYYHVLWDNNDKCYICKYGRLGKAPMVKKYDKTTSEMAKFMRTKVNKGYRKQGGFETIIGAMNNAEEYIRSLDLGL